MSIPRYIYLNIAYSNIIGVQYTLYILLKYNEYLD